MGKGGLTPEKAQKILHDGTVYGKPITEKQRKFFGAISNMSDGGYIEYNAPTHEHGGHLIDKMGNPTNDPNKAVAEIEKKEVSIRSGTTGPSYVLSDFLINPQTGNTMAEDAKRMERKMKGDDDISLSGRRLSRSILMRLNEEEKMKWGGSIKKMRPGGLTGEPDPTEPNYEERLAMFRYLRDNQGATLPSQQTTDMITPIEPATGMIAELPNIQPGIKTIGPNFGEGIVQIKNDPSLPISPLPSTGYSPKLPDKYLNSDQFSAALPPEEMINGVTGLATGNIGAAMKLFSGISSAGMALQKPEKESFRPPDYSAGDRYYANLGIDPQALKNEIMAASNASTSIAREGSGSFGQFMNRVRAVGAETGRQLSTTELQAKEYNDQIAMSQGSREDMKAQTIAQEQIRTQNADSANVAMRQDQIQNLLNQVDAFGTEMMANDVLEKTTANLNDAQKKQFVLDMATMEAKYPDFKISDEVKLLLTDPDATWEQIREALAKDLVQWRGTRIGEITNPNETKDGSQ